MYWRIKIIDNNNKNIATAKQSWSTSCLVRLWRHTRDVVNAINNDC